MPPCALPLTLQQSLDGMEHQHAPLENQIHPKITKGIVVVLVYHILYVCQRISLRADIHTYMRACMHTLHYTTLHYITLHYITSHHIHTYKHTSSTAQGGGRNFKNRKPIGEVGCCESRMAERSHWWTERWLMSPLFLSLSLSTHLPTYLLCIYLSIYLSLSLSSNYLSIYLSVYLSIYRSLSLSLSSV